VTKLLRDGEEQSLLPEEDSFQLTSLTAHQFTELLLDTLHNNRSIHQFFARHAVIALDQKQGGKP
jgi:hypothetical protein